MPTIHNLIPNNDPPFLGGAFGKGEHPSGTTYSNLVRPRELPPLVMTSNTIDHASPKVKTLVDSLCNGKNLSVSWKFGQGTLVLEAHYSGDDFVVSSNRPLAASTFTPHAGQLFVTPIISKTFDNILNDVDSDAISHRLLHLFLRTHGSKLGWTMANTLCLHLQQHYSPLLKNQKWKVFLDCCMLRADIAFTLQPPDADIGTCFCHVGEALEAQGRFVEAARIYQDATDRYTLTMLERMKQQRNAGLAWKRAAKYEASEEAYVKALHLDSNRKPLDFFEDDETICTLGNVINMYYEWVREDMRIGEVDENRLVDSLFLALLYTSGFKPEPTAFSDEILSECGPDFVGMLAPKYRKKRAAKKVVVHICSSSTAPVFRSRIMSCKHPDLIPIANTESIKLEKDTKGEKRNARKLAKETRFVSTRACSNPSCLNMEGTTPFGCCPCMQNYYCTKTCQKLHWPIHKGNCAYRAERKKNGKRNK